MSSPLVRAIWRNSIFYTQYYRAKLEGMASCEAHIWQHALIDKADTQPKTFDRMGTTDAASQMQQRADQKADCSARSTMTNPDHGSTFDAQETYQTPHSPSEGFKKTKSQLSKQQSSEDQSEVIIIKQRPGSKVPSKSPDTEEEGEELIMAPHQSMPQTGFQAIILCGPGVSLNTFTSNPEKFPKPLVPIANRPMVWYALEWCYRFGVTNIHLITPPSARPALSIALATDPHLTSLPLPRPDVLSPEGLHQNMGTAQIFRLPEVRAAITGDFIVLPCDLVSELSGLELLEAWMLLQASPDGETGGPEDRPKKSINGERGRRRGGIGVWYETRGEGGVKIQETDFIATAPLDPRPLPPKPGSVVANLSKLVMAMPTDTLKDKMESSKSFRIRPALLRKHPKVNMLMTQRDAHVYFFPYWVLDMMKHEKMESISEDIVGWWAKATWQDGLGDKLGLRELFHGPPKSPDDSFTEDEQSSSDEEFDLSEYNTTSVTKIRHMNKSKIEASPYAARVSYPRTTGAEEKQMTASTTKSKPEPLVVPYMLAYVQPPQPLGPIIRRVDTAPVLLTTSLYLAKLPSIQECKKAGKPASPLAHNAKIAYPAGVAKKTTITQVDCLVGDNVIVEERSVIKQSVIGANCKIEAGVRLTRCLLMDGVTIAERCHLDGCIIGKRSKIGKGCIMRDCEVQDAHLVPDGTEARNDKFMIFQSFDDEDFEDENNGNNSGNALDDDET